MVNLVIAASLPKPSVLTIADRTPASSWGGNNALRSAVNRYLVTLSYLNTTPYTWEFDGAVGANLATTGVDLTVQDFQLNLPAACSVKSRSFRSGCLNLRVQAVAEQSINRYRSNYTVLLPGGLPDGAYFFVNRNGSYANLTADGKYVTSDNSYLWQCIDTLDVFTDYKIIKNGVPLATGTVLVQQVSSQPVSRIERVVVGVYESMVFITATERLKWASLVTGYLESEIKESKGDYAPVSASGYGPSTSKKGTLGYIDTLLRQLEGSNRDTLDSLTISCEIGNVLLKKIQAELAQWP